MNKIRPVSLVAVLSSSILTTPAIASPITSQPQICAFTSHVDTVHANSERGLPTNSWVIISSILDNLETILYGQTGTGIALEVPLNPFAIQANLDAESFVLQHSIHGTPSNLDAQSRLDAEHEAIEALELLAAYPDLLTDQNQAQLTNTLTLILDDLGA